MRRALANLVLMVILWGYVAPAVLGATELDLPSCCRSHGKHHGCTCCMSRSAGDAAPGFHQNSPQCPYRLQGSVLYGSCVAEVKKFFSMVLPARDIFLHSEAAFALSASRIRKSGRGPPLASV
jgi:hypothetical protein